MPENQTLPPIDPSKLLAINQLINLLDRILTDLSSAGRATANPTPLIQINNEFMAVKRVMDYAVQAQAAANDILFKQATSVLNTQAGTLQGMAGQVDKIVSDVELAGRIAGYTTQAVALLMLL
jgi:hypothetical protein